MTDSLSRLLRSMTALVLLAGFLVSFVPDWTGLDGHQILGTALGALAGYHAWLHRSWIGALAKRLWKAPLGRGQWLWLLDAALAGAFAIIIGTGLLISTWVGLPEEALTLWINLHVVGSVTTLALVVVKVATHWRWFVQVFCPRPVAWVAATAPVRQTGPTRRDFLALMMGTLGVAALAAGTSALQNRYGMGLAQASSVNTETTQTSANNVTLSTAQATTVTESPSTETTATAAPIATVTTAPTATIEAASASGSASTTCAVRCQRGCSYPGRCRKYTDANGNGRCDFGECL